MNTRDTINRRLGIEEARKQRIWERVRDGMDRMEQYEPRQSWLAAATWALVAGAAGALGMLGVMLIAGS